jgi:hypothetical protein
MKRERETAIVHVPFGSVVSRGREQGPKTPQMRRRRKKLDCVEGKLSRAKRFVFLDTFSFFLRGGEKVTLVRFPSKSYAIFFSQKVTKVDRTQNVTYRIFKKKKEDFEKNLFPDLGA